MVLTKPAINKVRLPTIIADAAPDGSLIERLRQLILSSAHIEEAEEDMEGEIFGELEGAGEHRCRHHRRARCLCGNTWRFGLSRIRSCHQCTWISEITIYGMRPLMGYAFVVPDLNIVRISSRAMEDAIRPAKRRIII